MMYKHIPNGTLVKVINKSLGTYNKILIVDYYYSFGYTCRNLHGYIIVYQYRDFELKTLSYHNNEPFPEYNFKNSNCYFCGIKNKYFKIKNKYFYYCPKCLR